MIEQTALSAFYALICGVYHRSFRFFAARLYEAFVAHTLSQYHALRRSPVLISFRFNCDLCICTLRSGFYPRFAGHTAYGVLASTVITLL